MHGAIFAELKKYVVANLGPAAWNDLLAKAGTPQKLYLPRETYPDAEAVNLVVTASKITGKDPQVVLESFGEYIAPDLLGMYGAQVNPAWNTLDLLEHTEETIHRIVRLRNPGAAPPQLRTRRNGPHEVVITYASPRHMCSLAKGIVRGVAKHYKEQVRITEASCMLQGGKTCEIAVSLAGSGADR